MNDQVIFISVIIGTLGAAGGIAAVLAWFEIVCESNEATEKEAILTNEALNDLKKSDPGTWLHENGIRKDGHLGRHLVLVRESWANGRTVSLEELQGSATRLERLQIKGRVASFLSKFLVLVGIAGTLWLVHGVLKDFQLSTQPDGSSEMSKQAEKVTNLISALGDSFYPSLVALVSTVGIGLSYAFYARSASKFAQNLDSLLITKILPFFEVENKDAQFKGVVEKLDKIASTLSTDKGAFPQAVQSLEKSLGVFQEAIPELGKEASLVSGAIGKASKTMTKQAKNLAERTAELADALDDSLTSAARKIEKTAKDTETIVSNFEKGTIETSKFVEGTKVLIEDSRKGLEAAAGQVAKSIEDIPAHVAAGAKDIREDVREGMTQVTMEFGATLTEQVAKVTDEVGVASDNATKAISTAVEQQVQQLSNAGQRLDDISGVVGSNSQSLASDLQRLNTVNLNVKEQVDRLKSMGFSEAKTGFAMRLWNRIRRR